MANRMIRSGLVLLVAGAFALPATAAPSGTDAKKVPPTVKDIYGEVGPLGHYPRSLEWSPDGKTLTYLARNPKTGETDLYAVSEAQGAPHVLATADTLAGGAADPSKIKNDRERERITRYNVSSYHWAPQGNAIFFSANDEQLHLLDLQSRKVSQLTSEAGTKRDPKLSPDQQWVSYLSNGDLHYVKRSGGKVQAVVKHTDDVLNGQPDWAYTEEFDVRTAYAWSPDSRYLAFIQFDERPVKDFPLVDNMSNQATVFMQKYPIAGAPNPVVKLGVHDVKTGKTRWIDLAGTADSYLPRFGWRDDGKLWAQTLNRDQTDWQLSLVDPASGSIKPLVKRHDDAWIDITNDLHWLPDGRFVLGANTNPQRWHHLYLYAADGKQLRDLTPGDYNVHALAGVSEADGEVYYTRYVNAPMEMQLYRSALDGSSMAAVTSGEGWHSVNMAPHAAAYVDTWSHEVSAASMTLKQPGKARHVTLKAAPDLSKYMLSAPKFVHFTAGDGKTQLTGRMILPADFDPAKRYPVVMYQYGGPGVTPVVNGGFVSLWDELLAQHGYIVFSTDNRASMANSHADQAQIKNNLGELELADQKAAAAWLKKQPYVQADRVGIWGWSYGGYMTTYELTHAPGVWAAGIAVAPVTDWHLYDSIYTERYMSTPQKNPAGYKSSSSIRAAGGLADSLLLVAGTGDDNVHWQNTVQFVNALYTSGKPYDLQIYPNKTHGIAGADARIHLFTRMLKFWNQHLKSD